MEISTSSKPTPPTIKEEEQAAVAPEQATPPRPRSAEQSYFDYGDDLVARVRAAKAEAQRQMESFGDVSEYDIRTIQGLKKESGDADASATDTNTGETQS